MILTLEYAHEAGKVEIFQYLNKREDLPYDIDPVFEDHADEYFLEHYNQFIEEIIRSHLGDDEHPFPAPPGGDDAVYADGEPDTVSA